MASSSQLIAERRVYYNFRDEVNNLATKLAECYNLYYSVQNHISDSYQINSDSGDNGKIKQSCNSIKYDYELLIKSTIPAINSEISDLNYQIDRALEEEEEERQREEEERRKREEALKKSKSSS